jgi:hypothetical protein
MAIFCLTESVTKPAKSQWDFGELFPVEATRRVLSVSELTGQVKRLLEKQVGSIWVTGEITNFRAQNSGHIYFTLKDAGSQLSCVLFSRESVQHRELLVDGQKVLLQGDVTVYEARGQYQLIVRAVELQGVGALQIAFEKLKQNLRLKGCLLPNEKRPLQGFRTVSASLPRQLALLFAMCCTSSSAVTPGWKSFWRLVACKVPAQRRKSRLPFDCSMNSRFATAPPT